MLCPRPQTAEDKLQAPDLAGGPNSHAASTRGYALKTLQWTLTTFKGEGVRFGSGRAFWTPLGAALALRP
jgi:hypothetical protein